MRVTARVLALPVALLVLATAGSASALAGNGPRPGEERRADSHAWAAAAGPIRLLDADGAELSWERLVERARTTDLILVGESHLDPCDHRVQARTLETLAEAGLEPGVGLEMVGVADQPILDFFNERRIAVDALGDALRWPQTWGYPYSLYRPVFTVARARGLPLVALNIPSVAARAIAARRIELDQVHPRGLVPPEIIPPPADQLAPLAEIFERHGGLLDPERRPFGRDAFERFVYVQSLWDTQMATRALRTVERLERPVVVLAGAGHVERSGIPYRVKLLAPRARLLTMLPLRDGERPDPEAADVYFSCPGSPSKPAHP